MPSDINLLEMRSGAKRTFTFETHVVDDARVEGQLSELLKLFGDRRIQRFDLGLVIKVNLDHHLAISVQRRRTTFENK